jgi:hypothetical protein
MHALRPWLEGSNFRIFGALRGIPADGVGRDIGSVAGEGFPLKSVADGDANLSRFD